MVAGVSGNHDSLVLPRLAGRIRGFKHLGAGGRWECWPVPGPEPLDLLGWSFPSEHHSASPLDSLGLAEALAGRRPDAAAIGVIHADLDVSASSYVLLPHPDPA
jgi:membrane-associated phospholipid phosphatase